MSETRDRRPAPRLEGDARLAHLAKVLRAAWQDLTMVAYDFQLLTPADKFALLDNTLGTIALLLQYVEKLRGDQEAARRREQTAAVEEVVLEALFDMHPQAQLVAVTDPEQPANLEVCGRRFRVVLNGQDDQDDPRDQDDQPDGEA